jgi:hypothetical protein
MAGNVVANLDEIAMFAEISSRLGSETGASKLHIIGMNSCAVVNAVSR